MSHAASNVEAIFLGALDLPGTAARSIYLDRACGDPALRQRVERLLALDAEAGDFLEVPASLTTVDAAFPPAAVAGPTGAGLDAEAGPYRLREVIGEGGMGTVYLAEQARPVRRQVALKVIKPGMDSRQVIARFEAERQALALMDHPHIARVHDAGTTDAGRPYFAMELVRGAPITEFCDDRRLTIAERLELFVLACRAVQHAHQKGIIHRDLKPSNVLVTVVDGVAVPKVIDFGIAKATGGQLTDRTLYTGFYQFLGTPLYMSPEQAGRGGGDTDTRSDIYSLGVLLYELLTGTTPVEQEKLGRATFDELRRIVREDDPPRPSARLAALGERRVRNRKSMAAGALRVAGVSSSRPRDEGLPIRGLEDETPATTRSHSDSLDPALAEIAARRRADPGRLGRSLRGELDWITLKALEKDPGRRYETAGDLAADVRRYLSDRPVEACPPSAWYRFGKVARRNRAALAAAVVALAGLVAVAGASLLYARREARAAAEAEEHTNQLNGIISFLVEDAFSGAVPGRGRDRSRTAGELLEHTDRTVGERFPGRPLVEACVRMALCVTYLGLGDDARAEAHAARAAALRTQHLGPDHPHTLAALHQQCMASEKLASRDPAYLARAVALARRVVAGRTRTLGATDWHTVSMQSWLAYLLARQGQLVEAEALADRAAEVALRVHGPDHGVTAEAWKIQGDIAEMRGDLDRSIALGRRALAARERVGGPLSWASIGSLDWLANKVWHAGRLDEARRLSLDLVDRTARVWGPCHVKSDPAFRRLFAVLHKQGDHAAARDQARRWTRAILDTPEPADPAERERRRARLAQLSAELGSRPEAEPR